MPAHSANLMGIPRLLVDALVVVFPEDKRYQLLAYLAYTADWVSREHLAYLFWSESDPQSARKNLRHLLARVRALDWQPDLQTEGEYLRWPIPTDVAEFSLAYAQSDWEKALQAFGGVLLQNFSADDAAEFAAWLETERGQLTQHWRKAVFQQSSTLEASGKTKQSLELLDTLLGYDPFDEEALEHYMQAAAQAGESRHALRAYEHFASHLKQELGLPPTLNLERLAEGVRAQSQTQTLVRETAVAAPVQIPSLPVSPTPFVGRDLELAEVANALRQPECRLLTLSGPGGVGKTRIALQTALEQAPHFSSVHFVNLDSVDSPEQIPLRIAETLKLSLKGIEPPLIQLKHSIAEQPMLLVLDNYEHLLEGANIAAELLEACPNLRLLVTSRERLNLSAEWVVQVRGLSQPQAAVSLQEAQHYDALRLFVLRVQQVRPDFELDTHSLPFVLEICRMVEGFPLALELAAAWARVLPLEEIAHEIEGNLDFMVSPSRDAQPRHRSIEAVFEHSWKLLTKNEQIALRRLSVFFGGFRAEAVKQVSATPLPVLAALVDKSLLRLSPAGRYDRHALLYQYMQKKLSLVPAEEQETRANHSQYYLRFLYRAIDEIRGPNSKQMLETLEEELGNLRLAWTQALGQGRLQPVKEASEALMRFLDARGRYHQGIEMFEEVRQALDQSALPHKPQHQATLGTALVFLGKFQQRLHRLDAAEQNSHRGVDLLRALPLQEPETLIWGLGTLGTCADSRGQRLESRAFRLEALEKAREIANPRLIAVCSGWLAISEDMLGNYPQAIKHYREAIFLFKKQGNPMGTLHNTANLGNLILDQGDPQEALPLLQEALKQCQASGEVSMLGETLISLSRCYLRLGQLEPAWNHAQEALAALEQYPRVSDEIWLLSNLAQIALARGEPQQAQGFFVQALDKAWQDQQIPAVLEVLLGWASSLGAASPEAPGILRLIAEHPATAGPDREKAKTLLAAYDPSKIETPSLEEVLEHFLYG